VTEKKFELLDINISDTSEAPRARDIYYYCLGCGEQIPSQPDDSIGCRCDNMFIDVGYSRLFVRDLALFKLAKCRSVK